MKSHQVTMLFFKSLFKSPLLIPLPTNRFVIAMHLASLAAAHSELFRLCLASECLPYSCFFFYCSKILDSILSQIFPFHYIHVEFIV